MQRNIIFIVHLLIIIFLTSCREEKKVKLPSENSFRDIQQIVKSDTLRAGTMYGSTSYFLFREEWMGYDYEMVENFADYLKVNLQVIPATTESELFQLLKEGKIDIAAYNLPVTKALKKHFLYVFPQSQTYMVLVQNMGRKALSSVTDLIGKEVYVKKNTLFYQRLNALNKEIGGGIKIVIAPDSVSNDELIEMVANNKIDYTIAYYDKALLHKSYYKRLDCRLPISFEQPNGWLIRKENTNLYKTLSTWSQLPETQRTEDRLINLYWGKSPYFVIHKIKIPKGAISPYDHLFKKYAPVLGWDWRLLAAMAFHESKFDSAEISRAGALGLMQLMPQTAATFGLNKKNRFNPEANLDAATQYIKSLNLIFREIKDKDERIKFILASYNSGPSHVIDAMALAKKYGKNPHIWFNHVETYLLKKNDPDYYRDPVVKYGFFRGAETVRYVQNVLDTYEKYLKRK